MEKSNTQRGFTLHELMIAIAIFGILGGIGVPAYLNYVRNAELSNATSKIFADIYYARSEAIRSKSTVSICRSANANTATPTCDSSDSIWTGGWLVFIDAANNGVYENADDQLVKIGAPYSSNIQIKANANAAAYISFKSDGSLRPNKVTSMFSICDDRDGDGNYNESTGRLISIGAIGKPNITVGELTDCDNPS